MPDNQEIKAGFSESELLDGFFSGDRRSLSKILTKVENGSREERKSIIKKLWNRTETRSNVIGITGAPGVGKSTLVNELISFLEKENKVGVIAVDPSSPKSGGALLGDRIRMSSSDNVFVRSMATRGAMGGLAKSTSDAIRVMQAYGFDYVLVETVGAGQSEVDVMKFADTVLLVTMPELGDDIQALKAGLLEIGDIFVVNKSDKEGADKKVFELESMIQGNPHNKQNKNQEWVPPILKTVATRSEGIKDLIEAIKDHREHLVNKDELREKKYKRIREELLESLNEIIQKNLDKRPQDLDIIIKKVVDHELDPYTGSEKVLELLKEEL
uniref:LAO/AO transport system ATPase n=1 Tax=uncultured organism TaxID=155900 RepID=M1Q1P4_9ZZZZ|nr:LAO/AO transport system ATPase [uncultured organism]